MLRRFLYRCLGYATILSRYVPSPSASSHSLLMAHMLLEYIGPSAGLGEMLSNTWDAQRHDPVKRKTLFRRLARVMLALARTPQAQIGSFRFYDDGTITLTNRPLTCSMILWENGSSTMPGIIQRNSTYDCADALLSDLITCQDNLFLSDPNISYEMTIAAATWPRVASCAYRGRISFHATGGMGRFPCNSPTSIDRTSTSTEPGTSRAYLTLNGFVRCQLKPWPRRIGSRGRP
jgi:hypothetical protein